MPILTDPKLAWPCGVPTSCDLIDRVRMFDHPGPARRCHKRPYPVSHKIKQYPAVDDLPDTTLHERCLTVDPDAGAAAEPLMIPPWNYQCSYNGAGVFGEMRYAGLDQAGHGIGSEDGHEHGIWAPICCAAKTCLCDCKTFCMELPQFQFYFDPPLCYDHVLVEPPMPALFTCFDSADFTYEPSTGILSGGYTYFPDGNPCMSPIQATTASCLGTFSSWLWCLGSFYISVGGAFAGTSPCFMNVALGWTVLDLCATICGPDNVGTVPGPGNPDCNPSGGTYGVSAVFSMSWDKCLRDAPVVFDTEGIQIYFGSDPDWSVIGGSQVVLSCEER